MIIKDITSEMNFSNNFLKKYNFIYKVDHIKEMILSDKYESVRLDDNDKINPPFVFPAIYKKVNDISIKNTIFIEMSRVTANKLNCWSQYEYIPEVGKFTRFIVMSVDSKCLVKLKLVL